MRNLPSTQSEALERRGASLRLKSGERKWEMLSVQGPLDLPGRVESHQYFQIETTSDTLVVCRGTEEKGMRDLYLIAVMRSAG